MDRRARRHQETREEILTAAWTLAQEKGLTGWSMRDVAKVVGMQPPSLYSYFASKDAVYDAMFAQGYQALLDVSADPPGNDPREVLHGLARIFIDFAVSDPARLQLLFLRVVPGFEPSVESFALAEQVVEDLTKRCADAGVTDPGRVDLFTAVLTHL